MTPVSPHQPLHVIGRAMAGDLKQESLILRSGGAGHGADLGVADLATLERRVDFRQIPQRAGDADLFPGCEFPDAALEVEPVGQRTDADTAPAVAAVELVQQLDKAVVGRVEMPGQRGYFVFQTFAQGLIFKYLAGNVRVHAIRQDGGGNP